MTQPDSASRGRILIADDEPLVLRSLAGALKAQGFDCAAVSSGDEVLARLREQQFDALISDLLMPGNSGLSLFENVPQLAAGLPIVLITGQPSVETASQSLRLPIVAYLTKPIDFGELVHILDEAIFKFRAHLAMQAQRRHLTEWERGLDTILTQYRAGGAQNDGNITHYLQFSLRQVILALSQLEQTAEALVGNQYAAQQLQQLDREAALRHTVDVLRRTKQNFKSKELGELRKELERLLGPAALTPD